MEDLIPVKEFIQQVKDIEGVEIDIYATCENGIIPAYVRPYKFVRLPDDATVNDLKERIWSCIKPIQLFTGKL